jgi:hypothetical protein
MAMENSPFTGDFPIKTPPFDGYYTLGFAITMLDLPWSHSHILAAEIS